MRAGLRIGPTRTLSGRPGMVSDRKITSHVERLSMIEDIASHAGRGEFHLGTSVATEAARVRRGYLVNFRETILNNVPISIFEISRDLIENPHATLTVSTRLGLPFSSSAAACVWKLNGSEFEIASRVRQTAATGPTTTSYHSPISG